MADNTGKGPEKKVDEDWKKRAWADKEASAPAGGPGNSAAGASGEPEAGGKGEAAPEDESQPLPPATFLGLVAGMAAQASVYLGMVENPLTGKLEKDLEAAKHIVDTLRMLKEKSAGNLTETESAYLEDLLYGLQMGYLRQTGK